MHARQVGVLLSVSLAGMVGAGCETTARLASQREPDPPARTLAAAKDEAPPGLEPQNAATAAMEAEVLERINRVRQKEGLKPLRTQATLTRLARAFSRKMAVENFFSHDAPSGESFEDRIRGAHLEFARIGENIYKSYNTPRPAESAVQAWMKSPGHRHNILTAEFTETGIGVWKAGKTLYFTQDFIRPR